MKHKITLLFLLFLFLSNKQLFSQIEAVGSTDYGRIFNITYDPNVENQLYATSLYNHILVSHDNGENWDVLFSLSVNEVTTFKDLRMAQNNTALSFIKYNQGSPNNTLMILDLSSNAIINEIEIPYDTTDRYILSYSIFPSDSNIILMNTKLNTGTLQNTYYTVDGGERWSLVYSKSENDEIALNRVTLSPSNPEHLFLSRGLGPTEVDGGLFISTNAGETWTEKLAGIPIDPLVFNPRDNNEIYVGTGMSFGGATENLYKSIDGGESWEAIPITWTNESLDNITQIAINPLNTDNIIVLEENEIAISTDNGITWNNQVYDTDDVHGYYYGVNLSFNPFNLDELFIESDYHPQFSKDGGVTINWAKNKYFTTTGSLAYDPNGDGHLYYGVQYGYVHRNLNTGDETNFDILPLSWYTQGDAPRLFADKLVTGRVYHFSSSWFGSDFEVSTDYGQTKSQMFNTSMNYVNAVATDPFDSNIVWVSLSNTSGTAELKRVDLSDLNNIVSSNIALPENDEIKGINFDSVNSGHATITVGTKVYKTTDNATTWTLSNAGLETLVSGSDLILSLDSNPFNANQLTIASSKGIFTSLDGGDSWTQIYTGLVHEVYHSNANNGHLVGIVHSSIVSDFELIYSNNAGQTWELIDTKELLNTGAVTSVVKFYQDRAEVYIGSVDLGLLKYTINLETLGVDTPSLIDNNISIFPNPTKDFATVLVEGISPKSIVVYSLTGLKVFEVKNNSSLDLSGLSSGFYIIEVTTKSGDRITKKLIKQ